MLPITHQSVVLSSHFKSGIVPARFHPPLAWYPLLGHICNVLSRWNPIHICKLWFYATQFTIWSKNGNNECLRQPSIFGKHTMLHHNELWKAICTSRWMEPQWRDSRPKLATMWFARLNQLMSGSITDVASTSQPYLRKLAVYWECAQSWPRVNKLEEIPSEVNLPP